MPLLFLQNISGFMVGREYEARGIAKDGAKLVTAVACAARAEDHGHRRRLLRRRQLRHVRAAPTSPRFLFTWPNSQDLGDGRPSRRRACSRPCAATTSKARARAWSAEEEEAFKAPIRDKIEAEGSPYYATARLWDDGIILPSETRRVLALAFSATLNAPVAETRFGVFRM